MNQSPHNPQSYCLTVYLDEKPIEFPLLDSVITLGRRPENQIQVLHQCVSTCHLVFNRNPDGSYRFMDVGSSNGTMLNGMEVNHGELNHGDSILIGKIVTATYSWGSDRAGMENIPTFQNLTERPVAEDDQVILPA